MNQVELINKEFDSLKDEEIAIKNQRFFKMQKDEYAFNDKFLGLKVPQVRELVKKHWTLLNFEDIKTFLHSKFHEKRLFALLILVNQYKSKRFSDENKKEEIYNFYLENKQHINNWDLIDVTAPHIIGVHLREKKNRDILYTLANSSSLWDRRLSIISTFALINNKQYEDTLKLAKILLNDKEDLIHKAVGWAIRNVGNKNENLMCEFLTTHYKNMPRTMLRYAIEKLPEELRQKYLKGLV